MKKMKRRKCPVCGSTRTREVITSKEKTFGCLKCGFFNKVTN